MTDTTALKTSCSDVRLSTPYTLAGIRNAGQFVRHALHTNSGHGRREYTA